MIEDWNMEWSTVSGNVQHAYDTNLKKASSGEESGATELTEVIVMEIYKRVHQGESPKELLKEFQVCEKTIYNIKNKKTWKYVLT